MQDNPDSAAPSDRSGAGSQIVSPPSPQAGRDDRSRDRGASAKIIGSAGRQLPNYALVVVFVLLAAGFSIGLPGTFATVANVRVMISSQAIELLLALGLLLPLRSGDFDLSIASVMVMSGAVATTLVTQHHTNALVASVAALVVSVAAGSLNGLLVVIVGMDAFIATLGTMTILTGLTYFITNNEVITGLSGGIATFANQPLFSLPLSAFYGWVIALVLLYIFDMTPLGRRLMFVGSNREVARLGGLNVKRLRFGAFVGSSLLCGFAGIILVGSLGALDPSVGPQYLLPPYAAAFLGATTIHIGRVNVLGTVVALYLLVVGITGLELLGAPSWVTDVFNGGALIGSVLFAILSGRSLTRGR
jgi:ribose transport system permease protein